MKKLLIVMLVLASFTTQAQKNSLLEPTFWKGNADVTAVKAEIAKGNSPSQFNANTMDATVLAINNEAPTESIVFLLEQKDNGVDKLTHDGRTYLFWAASKGNVALMEHLLKKGAKAKMLDSHGATPLTFAAGGGQKNLKVYDLLIQNGANIKEVNREGANALLIAIPNDTDFTITDYFIAKGLSINSKDNNGNTAFNYAARGGNIEMMNKLIAKGVKFSDNAMIIASQGNRRGPAGNSLEVYQYLEGLKIKPTAMGSNGENVLASIARRAKQEEIVAYFVSKGVDVNHADNDGNTPFMNASGANRDLGTLKMVAKNVKDINQVNKKGVSATAMAVQGNSAEVLQLLLNHGADINAVDAAGNNLVYYLVQGYNAQRIDDFQAKLKMLSSKGLNVLALQQNGNSLYHLAVAKNDLELLKLIEGLKPDVNAKNKEGYTALHKAVMTAKDTGIIKYLLSIGAKKELTTDFKETTYELAAENEYFAKNNIEIDFLK